METNSHLEGDSTCDKACVPETYMRSLKLISKKNPTFFLKWSLQVKG